MDSPQGFVCRTRVRYGETDQMGVAYYGRYLDWEAEGILLPVVEVGCRYKSSLFYDDEIEIETHISEVTNVSVTFRCRVFRAADGKLAAEGWTRHAFVSKDGRLLRRGNPLADWMRGHLAP